MAEYSRLARGRIVSTGNDMAINLPFAPQTVELVNYTAAATPATGGIPSAYWDAGMGQGYAAYNVFNATPVLTTAVTATGGISTFSAGQMLMFGARQQVVATTKSSTTSIEVTGHGYSAGDVVIFEGLYQSPTTGMPQICGMPFTVVAIVDANNFTINWDSSGSNYTALSGSPTGAFVKKVLYPYLYFPGECVIAGLSLGTTTTVLTTSAHNMVVGQEVAFRITPNWGTFELNSLPNSTIPGSPIYGYVTAVTSYQSFTCNINSSSFTAFNANQTVASVAAGLKFPQVVAVGDINSGGVPYSGSALYPSPYSFPKGSVGSGYVPTINGPAILGSFVNNTSSGFVIGKTVAPTASQTIYWKATLYDYSA